MRTCEMRRGEAPTRLVGVAAGVDPVSGRPE